MSTESDTVEKNPPPARSLEPYQKWLGAFLALAMLALLTTVIAIWPGPPRAPVFGPQLLDAHAKARAEVARIEQAHLALLQPLAGNQPSPDVVAAEVRKLIEERAAAQQKLTVAEAAIATVATAGPAQSCSSTLCLGPEPTLLLLAAIAGALGGAAHAANSLAAHSGGGRMTPSWILWYYLRIPAGAVLGLIAYCVVRAGFVIGSVSALGSGAETINPFGVAAVSALAGISAKAILEKFGALADGVFGPRAPQQQTAAKPKATIDKAGSKLRLDFGHEPAGVKVRIDGRAAPPTVSGRTATVDLLPQDLAKTKLSLTLSGGGLPSDTDMSVDVPAA